MTMEELAEKNITQLKAYARKNNIDLFGTNTKIEMLEVIASFVGERPKPKVKKEKPIAVEAVVEEKEVVDMTDKVALYSTRNIHWGNIGALKVGYNIVSKEASEKMVTHKAVRIATPEELASYYGK
jgi:ATP phosphoribosyltransferase